MMPITSLRLDHLLQQLRDDQVAILTAIDEDPLLKRRQREDGLIIANAGPKLFEPQWVHQLFAKGIVYTTNPYTLVSLPLIKMFNHGLRPRNDATTAAVERLPGVRFVFPEKLDGTMIQLFEYKGESIFTTRSMMEGLSDDEDSIYVQLARKIVQEKYPKLLDPATLENLSLIFELIHPKSRQITRYGARQDMVVISIYDHVHDCYWTQQQIDTWTAQHEAASAEILLTHDNLEAAIETIKETLNQDPQLPEGTIVGFELGDQLIHRVKVKMASYLEHFSAKMSVSYKTTVEILWHQPHLHDWPIFLNHLISEKMSEEEVEILYQEYFETFMAWYKTISQRHQDTLAAFEPWLETHATLPTIEPDKKEHIKAFALFAKSNHPELFHLLMTRLRKGELSLYQVMWHDPAYPGMRTLIDPLL